MASNLQVEKKTRRRRPLSCESCRTRKLKCDRQKPCQNCTSRGLQNTCTFLGGEGSRRSGAVGTTSEDMRARLHRLESLVTQMAQASVPPAGLARTPEPSPDNRVYEQSPDPSRERQASVSIGVQEASLVQSIDGQRFIGASHWESVLQDLAIVREHFEDFPENPYPLVVEGGNPALLSGSTFNTSFQDLAAQLPNKGFSDRLITRFFESYDPAVPSRQLLHRPTFLQEYGYFWSNLPNLTEADFTILSTLFSVYCLALQSYDRQDDEPSDLRGETVELSEMYRKHAAVCLLKSNISTPSRSHLQAFLLYGVSEYARIGDEAVASQWFILGMIVRKAFHMGYHRDPDNFPNLSPFEKEMRRRLWAHVWQIDTLYSFSLGLPASVSKGKSNVKSPRNIFEEELFEQMTELPPSRPSEVMTPISFTVAKLRILEQLSSVVEFLNSVEDHTYDQIIQMNRQLQDAVNKVPEFLRIKSWDQSVAEPKALRLQRLQLRMFYDKAICTLNRKFLSIPIEHNSNDPRPRELCIESAMSLLHIQAAYHRERNKWFRFHLSRHDFLLAAVILFLIIGNKRRDRVLSSGLEADANAYDEEDNDLVRALSESCKIWAEHTSESKDAHTACRMFSRMSQRFSITCFEVPLRAFVFANNLDPGMGGSDPPPPVPAGYPPLHIDWVRWDAAFGDNGMGPSLEDPLASFRPTNPPTSGW